METSVANNAERFFQLYKRLLISLIILILALPVGAEIIHPVDDAVLNCLHVPFLWSPIDTATGYEFVLEDADGDVIRQIIQSRPGLIVKRDIAFGAEYEWRYRHLTAGGGNGEWVRSSFSTTELPDSVQAALETRIHRQDAIEPGYTITSAYGTLLGFDVHGNILWYIPGHEGWFFGNWDVRQLPGGSFLAIENRGARIFTPNDSTLWHSNRFRESGFHHALVPLPHGTFLGVEYEVQQVELDGVLKWWQSDYLIEINRRGEELWRWRCWDHIPHEDYDREAYDQVPEGGAFDWTHVNACPFDGRDSTIYVSVRNLNRIVKIAYPSGDIVWNMGTDSPSGVVDFGENIGFYKQHSPEIQPNGNLLLFDNHWTGEDDDYSRAIEIEIDPDRQVPAQIVWEYRHEFSETQGDADRLPNGNTLITTGQSGGFFEVDPEENLVWEAHTDFPVGTYRGERIASFFPNIFALTGPPERMFVPRWRATVSFTVYNIGEADQRYRYHLRDTAGWFGSGAGNISAAAGDSAVIQFEGHIPQDDLLLDTLTLTAYPLSDSSYVESWTTVVSPDPQTSVNQPELGDEDGAGLSFSVESVNSGSYLIRFELTQPTDVELTVFDQVGRTTDHIARMSYSAGMHYVNIDLKNQPSGSYFTVLQAGSISFVKRINLIH